MKNENMGSLIKNHLKFEDGDHRALKEAFNNVPGPSEQGIPCACPHRSPTKTALEMHISFHGD